MLKGTKATLLPNEAKDIVSAFLAFKDEHQEDPHDAWDEMKALDVISTMSYDWSYDWDSGEWRKIQHHAEDGVGSGDFRKMMRDQLAEQHFADVEMGLYDEVDNKKALDYDDRELCDPDDFEFDEDLNDGYFNLVEVHGHL